ncbi:hypothetical protein AGLY_006636 [Aphis glycines]|uniref:Uncharacterized protein n=1 Tax=Aphis glycines TaxID=307491 RepID=A0A6G0TRT7_APHGL|nr:hypothetical protein AGLY_006636 [Aphis glycines]
MIIESSFPNLITIDCTKNIYIILLYDLLNKYFISLNTKKNHVLCFKNEIEQHFRGILVPLHLPINKYINTYNIKKIFSITLIHFEIGIEGCSIKESHYLQIYVEIVNSKEIYAVGSQTAPVYCLLISNDSRQKRSNEQKIETSYSNIIKLVKNNIDRTKLYNERTPCFPDFWVFAKSFTVGTLIQPCNVSIDISRSSDFTDLYLHGCTHKSRYLTNIFGNAICRLIRKVFVPVTVYAVATLVALLNRKQ